MYQADTSSNLSDPDSLRNIVLTNLRVRLLRFHPLPGSSQTSQVAVRNFYAIYNMEVFGWCFCNGLENSCGFSEGESITAGIVSCMST